MFSEEMLCLVIPVFSGLCSTSPNPDLFLQFYGLLQVYHDLTCSMHLTQWEEGELKTSYILFLANQR